ncbi:DUF58 domain-containing protein [Pseudomonas agarici]|uniref:DUF58 domain-containing protein n=1 Tax=Pseudomonas agarici TaxID=46677 RepID=UPI0004748525|nr:DUF58 domain-containing protein [Pseudomonas agarici]NWC09810.1 DUF58 domain-containing protein [Pseudomonas agarici]
MVVARGAGTLIGQLWASWQAWLSRRLPPSTRIELTQRRIFIMPNRAGGVFVALLLLILLVAINYQNSLAYGLCFLLLSVFVVAILHTYRNLRGLVLSAGVGPTVFVGEQARFVVRLESAGKSHQAIQLGWSNPAMQTVDVLPGGFCEVQLTRPTQARGWLSAPRIDVCSSFPLGILQAWSWVDLGQQAMVYPQPLEGELPILPGVSDDEQDEGTRAYGPGVDDYQGLKSYQPGDSWRRLHWKAYSRGQGLLIKDFARLEGQEFCLDFLALDGDVEQRLSRLCYWVLELSRRQEPFALKLPGQRLAMDCGAAHCELCLRALALFGNGS